MKMKRVGVNVSILRKGRAAVGRQAIALTGVKAWGGDLEEIPEQAERRCLEESKD